MHDEELHRTFQLFPREVKTGQPAHRRRERSHCRTHLRLVPLLGHLRHTRHRAAQEDELPVLHQQGQQLQRPQAEGQPDLLRLGHELAELREGEECQLGEIRHRKGGAIRQVELSPHSQLRLLQGELHSGYPPPAVRCQELQGADLWRFRYRQDLQHSALHTKRGMHQAVAAQAHQLLLGDKSRPAAGGHLRGIRVERLLPEPQEERLPSALLHRRPEHAHGQQMG